MTRKETPSTATRVPNLLVTWSTAMIDSEAAFFMHHSCAIQGRVTARRTLATSAYVIYHGQSFFGIGGTMIRTRDIVLIAVVYAGIAAGTGLQEEVAFLRPLPPYLLMGALFLSFFGIDFRSLTGMTGAAMREVAVWAAVKLLLMPLLFWAFATIVIPSYALPILLVSGVSTGVVAPFMSNLLAGNTTRVVQLVIVTSVLVSWTLPAWVKVLVGAEVSIPFLHMARMLLLIIFVPLAAVTVGRRLIPELLARLHRIHFPVSLTLFFTINVGVFSSYGEYLSTNWGEVFVAAGLAFALAAAYAALGLAVGLVVRSCLDGLTGATALSVVNNLLVIVFSARFFGPQTPLLAAMYMLPFFVLVIPLRVVKMIVGKDDRRHG